MRPVKHPPYKDELENYLKGLIQGKYTLAQVAGFTGYTVVHLCNLKKRYKKIGDKIFINKKRKGKSS